MAVSNDSLVLVEASKNGLVVKTHGSAKAKEVENSIVQCISFKNENINELIKQNILLEEK